MRRLADRSSISAVAIAVALITQAAGTASARSVYVANQGNDKISVIDSDAGAVQHGVIATGAGPESLAITPNGARLYVANQLGSSISVIDTATRLNIATIALPPLGIIHANPRGIAITPDGSRVLVVDTDTAKITAIDANSNQIVDDLSLGLGFVDPRTIAITPDGSRAYVSERSADAVAVIKLADLSTITTIPLTAGSEPRDISITPNGNRVYVAQYGTKNVAEIDTASNVPTNVTLPGAPDSPYAIAASPNGSRVLAGDLLKSQAWFIDAGTNQSSAPFTSVFSNDIAFLPNSSRAYITGDTTNDVAAIDAASGAIVARVTGFDDPRGVAVAPDQGPIANFTSTVASAGAATTLDGTQSTDADGTIARYDWDFGDGATASDGGPNPAHIYQKAGSYQVALTVTDNEGASTAQVFTGQTVSLNGSAAARKTASITVPTDTERPQVRITHPKSGQRVRRRGFGRVRGTASDAAGISQVQFAVARPGATRNRSRRAAAPGGAPSRGTASARKTQRCRFITKSGRLSRRASRCSRPRYLNAEGTDEWSGRVRRKLPKGRYLAIARAKDNQGNKSRPRKHRFTIR